jgi:hypothetical protein
VGIKVFSRNSRKQDLQKLVGLSNQQAILSLKLQNLFVELKKTLNLFAVSIPGRSPHSPSIQFLELFNL